MAKMQEVSSAEHLAAEGGIASDESAVAEPEIERDKSSVKEPEKEPDKSAAAEGDRSEADCPIRMGFPPRRCGRDIHAVPDGIDEKPVCLMHSKDPCKQSGQLFEAFRLEFERTLEAAKKGEAHFEYFVFPQLDLIGRKFQAICRFDFATFTRDAGFFETTFTGEANFYKAAFTQDADFNGASFTKEADFKDAIFTTGAVFCGAIFTQNAIFSGATFTRGALFNRVTFTKDIDFNGAIFTEYADFCDTTFSQTADFWNTEFHGTTDWQDSRFLDRAAFRHTKFKHSSEREPSALFGLAKFSKPNEVIFEDVDLIHALFQNCDVSEVWFMSSVRWATRKMNRGLAVFEETVSLEQANAWGLMRDGQRDYRAIAQIYQQLKKNYDSRLDYWSANEFHYGEMEMKRLAVPTDGRLLWLRRWWHPRLSFVALYRWASDYGNSYGKPLAWLLGTLLAAALLFPIPGVGLKQPISGDAASSASVTYMRVWNRQDSWTNNFWTESKLIVKSGITAIDTATFQRTPEYAPAYPWGRVVAIFETLLTSSLFALFLLAIRRQFRR
jgi:uncharacterized protein YjbI with pentapeptide repeats